MREGRYYLQLAGAEARERLLLAAATEWGVPVSALVAKDGVITHAASKRRTTYGAIATRAAKIQLPDPAKTVKLRTPDKFTLYGTEQKNLDTPLKVTGEAKYSIDVRLPGMLYAAAKSCPVWGGKVKSYNFDAIKNMPGVHSAVTFGQDDSKRPREWPWEGHISGGVAVVGDTWWHAKQALDKMPIEWDYGPNANVSSASLTEGHLASLKDSGKSRTDHGNVDTAWGRAAKVVEASYSVPCLTQFLGGGYGIDNQNPRANMMAAAVAKTLNGRPVKLLWTREEDWGFGLRPRPMGVSTFKAAVDANGMPFAMEVHSSGTDYTGDQQFRGLTAPPYYVESYRYTTSRRATSRSCRAVRPAVRRTPSTWRASSTNSRTPPARPRTSTGGS